MEQHEKFLTVAQAAQKMHIKETVVRELCKKEYLVARKVGRTWQISEESVNVWLNQPNLPPKAFYQRAWFIGIAALIGLAAAFAGVWADTGLKDFFVNNTETIATTAQDKLRLVDISFDTTDEGQKVLDIKFRNVGNTVSYIKRAEIEVIDSFDLVWLVNYSQQEVTWTGNVILPEQTTIEMSQSIKAGDTDRVQFQFHSDGLSLYDESIYQIKIHFIYNETDDVLSTELITIYLPRQAIVMGWSSLFSEEEWQDAIRQNVEVLERFQRRESVVDPDFVDLVNVYREAGHIDP